MNHHLILCFTDCLVGMVESVRRHKERMGHAVFSSPRFRCTGAHQDTAISAVLYALYTDEVLHNFFFFGDWQPCRSDLQSGWCHKTRLLLEVFCGARQFWSPDQHYVTMLDDVYQHILGRTEGRGIGFWSACPQSHRKCLKCQSSSDGHSDHSALCAGRT